MIEAWIVTYALHSTALLGAAWILGRRMPEHWHAGRDAVWKGAVSLAIVTSALAYATPGQLLERLGTSDWAWRVGAESPVEVADFVIRNDRSDRSRVSGAELTEIGPSPGQDGSANAEQIDRSDLAHSPTGAGDDATADRSGNIPDGLPQDEADGASIGGMKAVSELPIPHALQPIVLSLFALGLGLAMLRAGRSWIRVRQVLGSRRRIVSGPLRLELDRLADAARGPRRVVLSDAPAIGAPLALGRNEICVPAATLLQLSPDERRAALAHELAHIVRRDPLWFTALHFLESLFFFLPLHRTARRAIQREAEFLCDDWAGRRTGSRLDLARCLAKVAEFGAPPSLPAPIASMAGGSPLFRRVRRLLEPEHPTPRGVRVLVAGSLATLAFTVLATMPRFTDTGEAAVARRTNEPAPPIAIATRLAEEAGEIRWAALAPAVTPARPAPDVFVVTPAAVADRGGVVVVPKGLAVIPGATPVAPLRPLFARDVEAPLAPLAPSIDPEVLDPEALADLELSLEEWDALHAGEGDRTFDLRIEGENGVLEVEIENDAVVSLRHDGTELGPDRYRYDDEGLVVWDEDGEEEIFRLDLSREAAARFRSQVEALRSQLPLLRLELEQARTHAQRAAELSRSAASSEGRAARREEQWERLLEELARAESLRLDAESRRGYIELHEMEGDSILTELLARPSLPLPDGVAPGAPADLHTEALRAFRERALRDRVSRERALRDRAPGAEPEERRAEFEALVSELRAQQRALERRLSELEDEIDALPETPDERERDPRPAP